MGVAIARFAFIGFIGLLAITPVRADDIVSMISAYRREHGLGPVKSDPQLNAVAERQAKAMAAAGVLDHGVAGSFASRISNVNTDSAAENIAAGTKTWSETLRLWEESPGHNANLLRSDGDVVGLAVEYNNGTRFKSYWAMVIAHKPSGPKTRSAGVVMTGPGGGYLVAAAPSGPDAAPKPAAEGKPEAKPKHSAKGEKSADKSPGLLDSIGTAFKRVTSPIRNLWN
jgi:Cysteine-rich secretory protein family